MAQRVGRGIALLFHDRGTRMGRRVSSTPRPHFTPGKDPVPLLQEAGWATGPVWKGGKSPSHRDSIPDRPSRNQSLFKLQVCGRKFTIKVLPLSFGLKFCHNLHGATGLWLGRKFRSCNMLTSSVIYTPKKCRQVYIPATLVSRAHIDIGSCEWNTFTVRPAHRCGQYMLSSIIYLNT